MDARVAHKCRETAGDHHDLCLEEAFEDGEMAAAAVLQRRLDVVWVSRRWP